MSERLLEPDKHARNDDECGQADAAEHEHVLEVQVIERHATGIGIAADFLEPRATPTSWPAH